ncbi:MAG: B12-binding domain-containing radical SAM protein [Candidatus Methylomirabilis sp.]|nr:B12-binding domain-containing radical SAM protein [Deltaproteobacteria bacterium]
MRTLLVYNVYSDELGSSRPPLGTGYLAQALEDAGVDYDVVDMKLGHSEKKVLDMIGRGGYASVGVTVYTVGHKKFFGLLKAVKDRYPWVITAAGGPHVTIMGKKILEECRHVDLAFTGEAEDSFVKFCKGEEYGSIPGLVFRDRGEPVCGAPMARPDDLDSINWPRYGKFELKKYANEIGVITSRGCPYPCTFCSVGLTLGRKVRVRSIEKIGDELEYWYSRGRRIFNFLDDNLTFYPERVFSLCDEIKKRGLKGLILRASNGLRADRLNREMLLRMREVGFRSFGIGVEAGNDKVLAALKKGETIAEIENAIRLSCELGFEVSLFFVYGVPGETMNDIEDSIKIAKKYPVLKADFYNLIPFPGTQLWDWVEENRAWTGEPMELLDSMDKNLRFSKDTGKPFFTTKELGADEREYLARRLRETTLEIQREGIERVFSRYGRLKRPMGWLASTIFFQKLFFNNNLVRRVSDRVRYRNAGTGSGTGTGEART